MGTSDGIAGNGDERGVALFYPFTLLLFYLYKPFRSVMTDWV